MDNDPIKEDLEKYSALDAVAASEGGKILIDSYLADAVGIVDLLCGGYKKLPEMELRANCAALSEKLDVVRTLTRSSINKDLASDALKEQMAL